MTIVGSIPSPEAADGHPCAWAAYASEGHWQLAPHHAHIGNLLTDVECGKKLRVVISAPPRHGKSLLVSRFFPSWWLGRHPEHKVMFVTMSERFSRKWGRAARDDFNSKAPELWGLSSLPRASTAEWDVYRDGRPTGGSMSSLGAGGNIVGRGADLLVLDDLIRGNQEARSETFRDNLWEWFTSAIETRLEPPGRVVMISTRWHHDDLIGRLASMQAKGELGDEWHFVNLPAIADGAEDPLGRPVGQALWPGRIPEAWLDKKRRNVGPYVWESQYQGKPTPTTGAMFKRAWFRYYEPGIFFTLPGVGSVDPQQLVRFATVDMAATKKTRSDYTVIASWGFDRARSLLVLLDLVRERLSGDEITPALKKAVAANRLTTVYVERVGPLLEVQLGHVLKDAVRAGVPIRELTPEGDKEFRGYAAVGAFAAGQVWFPAKASWLGEAETELLAFPEGRHDDVVDCCTYAVGLLRELSARNNNNGRNRGGRDDADGDQPRRDWLIGR